MGSLSNLYISQSYQSLIHLGTNNTASANLIELQDGLGNSIGVAVNTNGDLYLSGSLTASLTNGYVWVGNATNRTTLVATSSFGGGSSIDTGSLVTTSSFNSYTQSTNIRLNNLETTSASVNVSITNLNSTTASQGVSITNLNASSASQQISIDNLNTNSASVNTSISNINSATASLFSSASLALVTASFDNGTRNLTFTKGNTTQFSVNIPDVSGSAGNFVTTSSFNAYTQSNDQRVSSLETNSASVNISISNINTFTQSANISINALNAATSSYATSAITASSLITASVNLNTITFTKGDGTTFPITVNTGSGGGGTTNTGSLMLTGSIAGNILTFTKGDASTFNLTIPSATGSVFDTGSFATTGSNSFNGDQNITGSVRAGTFIVGTIPQAPTIQSLDSGTPAGNTSLQVNAGTSGSFSLRTLYGAGVGKALMEAYDTFPSFTTFAKIEAQSAGGININGSSQVSITGSALQMQGFTYPTTDGTSGQVLTTNGSKTLSFTTISGGGAAFSNPNLVSNSGSLFLVANTFNSASANLSHLTASAQNQSNLVFKNNNSTGDTILSGSNNIFTNPGTPTTGYKRYIGGANNLYLNHTNGINSQITASATSVSGVRPVMNNNIFQGTANIQIDQAVNPGAIQTYSNNIFAGIGATTINALAFTGSSFTFSDNILKGGVVVINPASASLAEIAAGVSGSGGIGTQIDRNTILGTGTMTINVGPKVVGNSFTSVLSNIINTGALSITNISSSIQVNVVGNINNIAAGITYSNAGAAGLAIHRNAGSVSNNFGTLNLVASASAITATGNICTSALTVTNRSYSGSLGSGSVAFNNNAVQGAGNTYTVSGSYNGTAAGTTFVQNAVFGNTNTFYTNVEGRGNYTSFAANGIFGQNLILTGSNNTILSEQGGVHLGRWNADDGRRNTTGENIFSVGTGTSTVRKTGFLIDSGSNTYVEGTFNVSGSTTLSGSLYIQSGSTLPSATGSSILTWNPTTGQVSQSPIATLISSSFSVGAFNSTITQSGSAAVSQSMTFNNTDISNGVSIVSNSQITLANTGTYNIQFSAQLLAPTGADTIWIWLKKNGTNVSNTGTKLVLKNNEASVAAWNFVVPANASDYFELVWQSLDGHATLLTEAAAGNYPAIPSVIVTVTQVE